MNQAIVKKTAEEQLFIHYTYKWNLNNIHEKGLLPSSTGQIVIDDNDGEGLYCVTYADTEAQSNVEQLMEEEVNWHKVYGFLNLDEDEYEYIELSKYVVKIVFRYSGDYYIATKDNYPFLLKGYVLIPCKNLNTPLVVASSIEIEEL